MFTGANPIMFQSILIIGIVEKFSTIMAKKKALTLVSIHLNHWNSREESYSLIINEITLVSIHLNHWNSREDTNISVNHIH